MLLATASPSRGKLSNVAASFRSQPRCPAAAQSFSRYASPATSLLLQLHRRPDLFAEAVNLAAVWVFPYCQRSAPCTTAPASFCSSSPAPPFFWATYMWWRATAWFPATNAVTHSAVCAWICRFRFAAPLLRFFIVFIAFIACLAFIATTSLKRAG